MLRIVNDGDEVITNQSDILNELAIFYTNLYNQKTEQEGGTRIAVDTFLEGIEFPKLEEEEADKCEGLVTTEEVGQALNAMKNGLAPDGDGLTVEFYMFFWPKLKILVTDTFNEAFASEELTYTQRQGIIILLHKGKDLPRDRLNNWRPITLTNTDYKLLAKMMARRMGLVVNKLINEDQVGYLKGRNISNILRNIDDVIDYLNISDKAGYLSAPDYCKAFDSISKDFIIEAFKLFGFGEQFTKWVKTLFSNTFSSINHGGWLSEPFKVNCGIWQGCPFSPLAFVSAVKILAIKIQNSIIKGIELPKLKDLHINIKCRQLADDTSLFLKD